MNKIRVKSDGSNIHMPCSDNYETTVKIYMMLHQGHANTASHVK
jgi:hypothetical protein